MAAARLRPHATSSSRSALEQGLEGAGVFNSPRAQAACCRTLARRSHRGVRGAKVRGLGGRSGAERPDRGLPHAGIRIAGFLHQRYDGARLLNSPSAMAVFRPTGGPHRGGIGSRVRGRGGLSIAEGPGRRCHPHEGVLSRRALDQGFQRAGVFQAPRAPAAWHRTKASYRRERLEQGFEGPGFLNWPSARVA